jgi:HK97 gp10 family phage protein
MKLQFEVTGFAELAQAFKELNVDLQDKVGFQAVAAGAKVFKEQIQANVRSLPWRDSHVLEQNIAILRIKDEKFPELAYEMGVRGTGARGKKGEAPFYWWFHEFGYTLRDGTHKAPTPFVTPAIADQGTQARALSEMAKVLEKMIAKANNR